MNYLFDPELFRQVVFIGAFSGLILGLGSSLLGLAINLLYYQIRRLA